MISEHIFPGIDDNEHMTRLAKILCFAVFPLFAIVAMVDLARADDADFFDHNYAATGIVRSGSSRIAPEVKAPDRPADQMLQTEAKPEPKGQIRRQASPGVRPKSYSGRFVNRQGGTEARRIPNDLGEVGTDLP